MCEGRRGGCVTGVKGTKGFELVGSGADGIGGVVDAIEGDKGHDKPWPLLLDPLSISVYRCGHFGCICMWGNEGKRGGMICMCEARECKTRKEMLKKRKREKGKGEMVVGSKLK
jgi:hypothetical protein